MEIYYDIKPEDFYEYGRNTAKEHSGSNAFTTAILIMWALFVFADLIYHYIFYDLSQPGTGVSGIMVRALLGFGAMAGTVLVLKLIAAQQNKKMLAAPPNGMLCEHRLIIDEIGLTEMTDVNTSRYSWKAIGQIKELQSFYVVELTLSGGFLIPKRCFPDSDLLKNFVQRAEMLKINSNDSFELSHIIQYDRQTDALSDQNR